MLLFATLKLAACSRWPKSFCARDARVIRPIHILWNQVIGFFFLVLALLPVPSAVRVWGKDGAGPRLL